ncbi:hypothetical protein F5X96DRAFT_669638 [Biscogniauxia mediterranea]|nr:hypothetical protein F5X96DRAFT_669638 [Biscogniauxia mediterranea]
MEVSRHASSLLTQFPGLIQKAAKASRIGFLDPWGLFLIHGEFCWRHRFADIGGSDWSLQAAVAAARRLQPAPDIRAARERGIGSRGLGARSGPRSGRGRRTRMSHDRRDRVPAGYKEDYGFFPVALSRVCAASPGAWDATKENSLGFVCSSRQDETGPHYLLQETGELLSRLVEDVAEHLKPTVIDDHLLRHGADGKEASLSSDCGDHHRIVGDQQALGNILYSTTEKLVDKIIIGIISMQQSTRANQGHSGETRIMKQGNVTGNGTMPGRMLYVLVDSRPVITTKVEELADLS